MATTPTPTPITPPTSNDLAQLRQDAVTASTPAAPPPESPPTPAPVVAEVAQPEAVPVPPPPLTFITTDDGQVEIRTETGGVYRGATEREALEKIALGKIEGDKLIRQLRTPQPIQELPPQPQPISATPVNQELREGIMWMVNGLKEVPEARDILAEAVFGVPASQLTKVTQAIQSEVQKNTAAAFHELCPDFPATQEASAKLMAVAQQLGVPSDENRITDAHLPLLVMAHAVSVNKGFYQPVARGQSQQQPAAQRTANPMLNSSSPAPASGAPTDSDLRTMPLAQLRELAIKGGQ